MLASHAPRALRRSGRTDYAFRQSQATGAAVSSLHIGGRLDLHVVRYRPSFAHWRDTIGTLDADILAGLPEALGWFGSIGARRPGPVGPADGTRIRPERFAPPPRLRHPELCARQHQRAWRMGLQGRPTIDKCRLSIVSASRQQTASDQFRAPKPEQSDARFRLNPVIRLCDLPAPERSLKAHAGVQHYCDECESRRPRLSCQKSTAVNWALSVGEVKVRNFFSHRGLRLFNNEHAEVINVLL